MDEKKILVAANVSLSLVAFLLVLTLFDITIPTLGEALYRIDREDPLCIVHWQDHENVLTDLPQCCLEARRQVICGWQRNSSVFGTTDWICQTPGSEVSYLLNNKAYYYCTQQAFWR